MKPFLILLAVVLGQLPAARAQGYSTGFGTDYDKGIEVAGQNGWNISDPTPYLSYFVRLNGSNAAALGGYYDSPMGQSARLFHHVGIPFSGASFFCLAAVIPSTQEYPGRDTFGWTLVDVNGDSLFSLHLVPAANNRERLNIKWSSGTGPLIPTDGAITYLAPFTFELKFTPTGSNDLRFSLGVKGSSGVSFNGLLPGAAGKTLDTVGVDYIAGGPLFGDNFMVFDNLTVMPMPVTDADGDGFSVEMEEWFGTSDSDVRSSPKVEFSMVSGQASLRFPSVPGRAYLVESSENFSVWSAVSVTATKTTTTWLEPPPSPAQARRFFRISKP